VPQQLQQEFLSLIACADVMLDTIHFNGMNSSLEAFAMGTPVVTWPREFQRGRHTSGMYRRMGFEDLVADSADAYVRIAIRLGQDSAWRQQMRERIRERCGVLFEDSSVVRQFEGFFVDALTERASACSSSS
jgi:predicted O-linked N-acetylglucosamine transferase (SPINDLY family)